MNVISTPAITTEEFGLSSSPLKARVSCRGIDEHAD